MTLFATLLSVGTAPYWEMTASAFTIYRLISLNILGYRLSILGIVSIQSHQFPQHYFFTNNNMLQFLHLIRPLIPNISGRQLVSSFVKAHVQFLIALLANIVSIIPDFRGPGVTNLFVVTTLFLLMFIEAIS